MSTEHYLNDLDEDSPLLPQPTRSSYYYKIKVDAPWEDKLLEIGRCYSSIEKAELAIKDFKDNVCSYLIYKCTEEFVEQVKAKFESQ